MDGRPVNKSFLGASPSLKISSGRRDKRTDHRIVFPGGSKKGALNETISKRG